MTNVDQFESVFRSAAKPVFSLQPVALGSMLVVTDLPEYDASLYADRVRAFLAAVISVMEHARVLALIGRGLTHLVELGGVGGPGALLVSSSIASAFTDNIPLSAMLAKILATIPGIGDDPASPFWWAVIFGANLGGNITPIGSASTLVAVTIIHKNEISLTFAGFVTKAIPFALMQIGIALVYVLVVLRLFG